MKLKKVKMGFLAATLAVTGVLSVGCAGTGSKELVVIYTNADDEAVDAMKKALDNNGYGNQYILQSLGTSELGGKLLAEGKNIEADLVTMSSYYVESAQEEKGMFLDLTFDPGTLDAYESFLAPITAQEGALIYNTQVFSENNLPLPIAIADLADPIYEGFISVTDVQSSSTAWLLIQALVSEYGEEGAQQILSDIYTNAGAHIESSGSAPIKKARTGEVGIGFGLRHQAVADKVSGLPIDYVDPAEGNFVLTESLAVVDKGEQTNPLAMEMAECIIKEAREDLLKVYPVALYEGEVVDSINTSHNTKLFDEKLTVALLKQHQALSEAAK